jgi:phosphoribosyl 1,2-cyclic phosphate phosphodiesterase
MMKLTFLGTGTSLGSPVIACDCAVCRSADPRDRRLRTSALIEAGDVTMVIDAGPDFRQQMLRADVRRVDGILLTHEHKDHTAGLDDVRAFNYAMRAPMNIYATERVQEVVRKDFDYAFAAERYHGAPRMTLHTIGTEPFEVAGVEVTPIRGMHAKLPVTGFRIGLLAYLTDFSYIDDAEVEKLRGVEVLVLNALRRERHHSHFTLDEALELSGRVGARYTFFTHVSHEMGRMTDIERELPPNTFFAYDGLSYEFQE